MNKLCGLGIVLCAGAVSIVGCQSAATRIYMLDVATHGTRLDTYQAPALRVDTLSLPAGWDRIEILRPSATGGLEISDFDHWSAPLGQVARQTLSADLSERLPSGSVIYPRLPKPLGALGVNVDILEIKISGSSAVMQASWVITPAGSSTAGAPAPKRSEARLQESLSSAEPADVARVLSALLGQLADRIAADAALFKL